MRKTNILFHACALSTGILILSGCNEPETPARQESPLQIAASIAPERTPSRADASPSPSSYDKTSFQANDIIKVERKADLPPPPAPIGYHPQEPYGNGQEPKPQTALSIPTKTERPLPPPIPQPSMK